MKSSFRPQIVGTSVTGLAHIHCQQSCQDYFCSKVGKNIVAVVSDGAGSTRLGKIGAKTVCNTLCDLLQNADFSDIEINIEHAIKVARNKLILHRLNPFKSEQGLEEFAATLVGVVYHQNRGIFFHIGDGAAIAIGTDYADFVASRPANGTFSCETFFYTQSDWHQNLRFTRFDNASTIFLMSDGLTNFSFNSDLQKIDTGFIVPIDNFLRTEKSKSKAVKALFNTLNIKKAHQLNSDDKTLVWIKVA